MSFVLDLERFAKKTEKQRDTVIRVFVLSLFRDCVLGTPVDTGRARANWQFSIGRPAGGTVGKGDKNGGGTIRRGSAAIRKAQPGVFYITNNLPYLYGLEFEGKSGQAPAGWVRTSIQRNIRILERGVG